MMATPVFCSSCGQALKAGAKFCANCGADVVASVETNSSPVVVSSTPNAPSPAASQPQHSPDGRWWWDGTQWTGVPPPTQMPPAPQAKKGWSMVRILVIVFIIVPLLIVAAVTVFLALW
jgi:hypothetical protein